MGTTIVAATVIGNTLYAANVGDSRLYVINQEDITQITRDHSLVEEMVRLGEVRKKMRKIIRIKISLHGQSVYCRR